MSGQSVNITLTVDEMQALAAYARQQKELDKLKAKANEIKSGPDPMASLKQGMAAVGGTFKDAALQIVGISSAVGGLMVLANQLKNEYANLKSMQKDAAGTSLQMTEQLYGTIGNLGGTMTANQIQHAGQMMGARKNQKPSKMIQAIGTAGAVIGPSTAEEKDAMLATIEAAVDVFPVNDPTVFSEITTGVAGVGKRYNIKPKQAIGANLALAANSAVSTEADVAQHLIPTLMTLSSIGATPGNPTAGGTLQEVGGLLGAITNLSIDKRGDTSKTSGIAFASALNDRVGHVVKGYLNQVHYLQQNPEAEKAFHYGGTIEGKKFVGMPALGGIKNESAFQMMTKPGTPQALELETRVKNMGGPKEWEAMVDQRQRDLAANPGVQLEIANRAIEAANEQIQLNNPKGAQAGIMQNAVSVFKSLGETQLSQSLAGIRMEWDSSMGTSGPLTAFNTQLQERIDQLESTVGEGKYDPAYDAYMPSTKSTEQQDADRKKAEDLKVLHGHLTGADRGFTSAMVIQAASNSYDDATYAFKQFQEDTTPTQGELNQVIDKSNRARQAVNAYGVMSVGDLNNSTQMKQAQEMLVAQKSLEAQITKLIATMAQNNALTAQNNQVTSQNTEAVPRSGTQPTVRPTPVTSLQNARPK